MAEIVKLGGSANAACPVPICTRTVAFFSGESDAFISEVCDFAFDTVLELECSQHGTFHVRAGDLRDRLG